MRGIDQLRGGTHTKRVSLWVSCFRRRMGNCELATGAKGV